MSETYYRDTEHVPFASRLGMQARRRIYAAFLEALRPEPEDTVLDVGVTSNTARQESNFFEHFYPYKDRITCVGTEDGSHLEKQYPGLRFQLIKGGDTLPFKDGQFDIAFSNAVLEHTGTTSEQARFVAEIARVSRRFFIATPNRWFPVEHHTGLPLLHYLPQLLYRSLLRRTPYRFWADEANLHMLSQGDLLRLVPKGLKCGVVAIRVLGLVSNLAIWGPRGYGLRHDVSSATVQAVPSFQVDMAELKEGDQAPEISLQTHASEPFTLSALKGKNVILYFYPKADTPGCTKEACAFRDAGEKFTAANTVIVGVSPDASLAQAKFRDKFNLPFALLADIQHKAAEDYGVWGEKSIYGKKYMGVDRATFVIDPEGKIKKIFPKVKVDGHAEEVLALVQ